MENEIKFCPKCGSIKVVRLTGGYICPDCGWGTGGTNYAANYAEEIPLDAHDSELQCWEYTIPEGYVAEIKDGKVIVKKEDSEDERIRKFLVKHVSEWIGCIEHDLKISSKDAESEKELAMFKAALAYLEKQKEQNVKVISWREPDDCADIPEGHYVVIAYKPGVLGLGYIANGKVVCAPEHKPWAILYIPNTNESIIVEQKEQNLAEDAVLQKAFANSKIDYTLEEKCDASDYAEAILPTSITYGENEEEYKLHKIIEAAFIAGQKKEQKPAEKQDYSGLNDLERAIHRGFLCAGVENVPVTIIKETAKECQCLAQIKPAEWSDTNELVFKDICEHLSNEGYSGWVLLLQALHNGEFGQTQEEWSEEDEQWMAYFEQLLEFGYNKDPHNLGKCCMAGKMWLKSLRSQPHWKPSEEQMAALYAAIPYSGQPATLESLRCDLKKLM